MEKIRIKDNWNEVTVKDFRIYHGIQLDENLNDLEKQIKTLCLLSGKEDNYFDNYTIDEIKDFFKPLTFLTEEPKGELKDIYIIGGKKYKLIKDLSKLYSGQYIDLNEDLKQKDLYVEKAHIIAARLLMPVKPDSLKRKIKNTFSKNKIIQTEKYFETPIEETIHNIYENGLITDILAISVFFYLLGSILIQSSLFFLENQKSLQLKQALQTLKKESQENPKLTPMLKKLEILSAKLMDGL